jgi:DNA-directed RNA polymerase
LQRANIAEPTVETPVFTKKQQMAFPSNFVHSLVATHIIMSAIACKRHGISFTAVYDNFWTHACDIDTMNKVLREQFIKLHQQPLMENLRNEFIERYKGHMIPDSILKEKEEVNLEETELLDSESATLMNPSDLADEEEELFDDLTSDPGCDDVSLEGAVIQTEEREPKLVENMGKPRKERWVPIEFPPLPPRSESNIIRVRKNRHFLY